MRNFIPKRNNLYRLPHNTYMQMLYILRDYLRIKQEAVHDSKNKDNFRYISDCIKAVIDETKTEYSKRSSTYGELDPYKAFFEYGYYSYMYARKYSEYGASKNAWGLYRSKFAYCLADKLGVL